MHGEWDVYHYSVNKHMFLDTARHSEVTVRYLFHVSQYGRHPGNRKVIGQQS